VARASRRRQGDEIASGENTYPRRRPTRLSDRDQIDIHITNPAAMLEYERGLGTR